MSSTTISNNTSIYILDNKHTIQIASDLYVDKVYDFKNIIKPRADILVLAGDIGCPRKQSYKQFLLMCSNLYKHVILIAGNYEYHSSIPYTMDQVNLEIVSLCSEISSNVHYLYSGTNKIIGNYNFIGATLWSNLDTILSNQENNDIVQYIANNQMMNDHTKWTSNEYHNTHIYQLGCIERKINEGLDKNLWNIIVTHHAPLYECIDYCSIRRLKNKVLYASQLSNAIDPNYIKAWFYGHTHYNTIIVRNNVIIATNQRGMNNNNKPLHGWNDSLIIDIT